MVNKLTVEDYRKVVEKSIRKDVSRETSYFPAWKISTKKKEQMIVNRIRAGHSFMTHSHLITKEPILMCQFCDEDISFKHIFECPNMGQSSYASTDDWKFQFNFKKWKNIKNFLIDNESLWSSPTS